MNDHVRGMIRDIYIMKLIVLLGSPSMVISKLKYLRLHSEVVPFLK